MCKKKLYFWTAAFCIFTLIFIGWCEQVECQDIYPRKSIQIIIPLAMGGALDVGTRITATYLSRKWNVPVNVVNKPGGNYVPGMLEAYKAAPDGYTMLGEDLSTAILMRLVVKDIPFDPMARTYIAFLTASPMVVIVPSTSQIKTTEDLIAAIKKDPESISYTSIGGSGTLDFVIRQFFKAINVDIKRAKPIVVTGGGPAVTLTAGGNVTLGCSSVSGVLPAVNAGTVRALFVTSKERWSPELANVPTSAELGYPSVNLCSNIGISGPPKLPSNIVSKWEKDLEEIIKDPEYISKFHKIGGAPFYHNAQAFRARVVKDLEDFRNLSK